MVRARDVGDGLGRPRSDRLPERLGPLGRRGHGEQRQEQCERPQGEQQPLVDPPAVPPLGNEEEPDGRPRDDLVSLAEEQVNEDRHPDRDRGGAGGEGGAEDAERDHGCGCQGSLG